VKYITKGSGFLLYNPNQDSHQTNIFLQKEEIPKFPNEPYSEPVKRLRSALEDANLVIHQVEEDTGLKLTHYKIELDGFRYAVNLGSGPYDIIKNVFPFKNETDAQYSSCTSAFYRYEKYGDRESSINYYIQQVSESIHILKHHYLQRRELLEDYQRVWNNADKLDDTICIHYGLYHVLICIPLLTLTKYGIVCYNSAFKNASAEIKIDYQCVYLRIPWSEYCINRLDDVSYMLTWKIREYEKTHKDRLDFVQFRNQRERFRLWEQKFLAI